MSDVGTVAAISGGFSFLSASVGALTTYLVNRRNMETTIATARNQSEVELARIEAENQRLRETNREDERRNRQSTYHDYLDVVVTIYNRMGREITAEEANGTQDKYRYLQSGIVLFAPQSVRAAAYDVSGIYNEVWDRMAQHRGEHPEKSEPERWMEVTSSLRDQFGQKVADLTNAMNADITRGLTEDPDP